MQPRACSSEPLPLLERAGDDRQVTRGPRFCLQTANQHFTVYWLSLNDRLYKRFAPILEFPALQLHI